MTDVFLSPGHIKGQNEICVYLHLSRQSEAAADSSAVGFEFLCFRGPRGDLCNIFRANNCVNIM
ncbi:MAG: hypothetical protein WAM44_06055 [Chthoniobacterales bacterium]